MKALSAVAATVVAFAAALPALAQDDRGERERIAAQRMAVEARFGEEERACYRRFAVTDCIAEARHGRNEQLSDLRRQELVLNEADRKQRAAERLRELDERTSPQRQQELAERRARAQAGQQERQQRAAGKAAQRAARQVDAQGSVQVRPPRAAPSTAAQRPAPPASAPGPAADAGQPERNRQERDARVRAAQAHKAEVLDRLARRGKPPAPDLPTP